MPRPHDRQDSLVASGQFVVARPRQAQAGLRPLGAFGDDPAPDGRTREWQTEAYSLGREVGEVGFLHEMTSNTIASCDIRVTEKQGDELVASTDERPLRVMEAFYGPRGGLRELVRRGALNKLIAGEVYLLGTPDSAAGSSGLFWEFLSMREIVKDPVTGETKRKRNGTTTEDLPAGTYLTRWWTTDPEYSNLPDSAMRRAIPILRQLASLQQVTESVIKSRLAADVILIPDGMTFANEDDEADDLDENDSDAIDAFTEALLEHLRAPVEDRRSAAALVPLVWRGSSEDIAAVKLLGIGKDIGEWASKLREELLRRVAQILDAPPEMLQGKGNLNHWSGFQVDNDFASKHITPLGDDMVEWLTANYLRPMLITWEGMSVEEADRFQLDFDPSNIEARADAGLTGIQLWRERVINRKATVRSNGMKEDDLLTDEELGVEILRDIVSANPEYLDTYKKFIPGLEHLPDAEPPKALIRPDNPTKEGIDPAKELPRGGPRDPNAGGGEPSQEEQKAAASIARASSPHLLAAVERLGATVYARAGESTSPLPDEVILDLELGPIRDAFAADVRLRRLCSDELAVRRHAAEYSIAVAEAAVRSSVVDRIDPNIVLEHVVGLRR